MAILAMLIAVLTSARMQNIVTRPILAIADIARHVVTTRDYSVRAVIRCASESANSMTSAGDRRSNEVRRCGAVGPERHLSQTDEIQLLCAISDAVVRVK